MEHIRKIGMIILIIIGAVLGYMAIQRYQEHHQPENVKIQTRTSSCSDSNPCPSGQHCVQSGPCQQSSGCPHHCSNHNISAL